MTSKIIFFSIFLMPVFMNGQTLNGPTLLEKSIQYHDPENAWPNFNEAFKIHQTTPNKPSTLTTINLNNSTNDFKFSLVKEGHLIEYIIKSDSCYYLCDGLSEVTDSLKKSLKLDIIKGFRIRNYYTYLWGLPMKLKDPGTLIDPKIEEVVFNSNPSYKMSISYTPEVGKDIWYFYFDKKDYSLMGYEFYHDESKNDGKYILLNDIIDIGAIKIPKERSWYTHKNNLYLGRDKVQ